jgi:hypothetical protein
MLVYKYQKLINLKTYMITKTNGVFNSLNEEEFKAWEKDKGFEILNTRTFQDKNGNDYKQVHLRNTVTDAQYTALLFPSFFYYPEIVQGIYIDDIIVKETPKGFTITNDVAYRQSKENPDAKYHLANGKTYQNGNII